MPPLILYQDDKGLVDVPVVPFTLFGGKGGKAVANLKGIASWSDPTFTLKIRDLLSE